MNDLNILNTVGKKIFFWCVSSRLDASQQTEPLYVGQKSYILIKYSGNVNTSLYWITFFVSL